MWTFDEHRLGLKPILRRVWAAKGERPIAPVHHRYKWLYLYAFANPETGRSVFYILPHVDSESLSCVLENLAHDLGASEDHAVLLVLDQAGELGPLGPGFARSSWHTSNKLRVPKGIEPVFLPPYSPELQQHRGEPHPALVGLLSAERLWNPTDEPLANRVFDTLADLQKVLSERCAYLRTQPDLISQHTLFHWWPLT